MDRDAVPVAGKAPPPRLPPRLLHRPVRTQVPETLEVPVPLQLRRPAVHQDSCDSDDASSSDGGEDKSLRSAVADKVRSQLPAFVCGAATTWAVQIFLWRRSSECAAGPDVDGGCFEVRHMAHALHTEVEAARQLLADCRAGRPSGTSLAAEPLTPPTAVASQNVGVDLRRLHASSAAGFDGVLASAEFAVAADSKAAGQVAGLSHWVSVATLFFLDAGLIYFCLWQCASPETKSLLERTLSGALRRFGLQASGAEGRPAAKASRAHTDATGQGLLRPAPSAGSRIDPSGDALLVRRCAPAPARQLQSQRAAEEALQRRQQQTCFALGGASILGVIAARCVAHLARSIGLRFFNHLVVYGVLTVRVCLLVLLVLF